MRLKILVVEDDPKRMDLFLGWLADDDSLYVNKAGPAIQWVNDVCFDLVLLDHDLEDGHYGLSAIGERTGHEVARAIASLPEAKQPFVIVNLENANLEGDKVIMDILEDANVRCSRCSFGPDLGRSISEFRYRMEGRETK